jgi:DNA segregation ATPase FtsK/SpoIIIE-like protein
MSFVIGSPNTTGQPERHVDFTAGLLQATLSTRNIQAIVAPLWDGPQIETYSDSLALGVKPEAVERLTGALALAAGANSCRISRASGRLLVEVPKPPGERKTLPAHCLMNIQPPTSWHVPIGVGATGKVVWFNLADERMCHVVIGGTTRSGKTNALHWLLLRLLSQNPVGRLQLLLLDPKGFELQPFSQSRHLLHPPEHRTQEIIKILMWVQQTMAVRAANGVTQPRIMVVIDEVRELVEQERRVQNLLASLAQIGAGIGIHLIATTQQPGAKALGDALANFPCRLLGRVSSATLTYGAAGRARSQAEQLLGRGDFLLITQDGYQRLQVPLVTHKELSTLPQGDRVNHLELGEFWNVPLALDSRGGWNRKPLDLDTVRQAVGEGATAATLGRLFGINFDRAQRLVAQFGGDDEN